jgi:hypothetical protein
VLVPAATLGVPMDGVSRDVVGIQGFASGTPETVKPAEAPIPEV